MENGGNYVSPHKYDPLSVFLIFLYFGTQILGNIFQFLSVFSYLYIKIVPKSWDSNQGIPLDVSEMLHLNSCLIHTFSFEPLPIFIPIHFISCKQLSSGLITLGTTRPLLLKSHLSLIAKESFIWYSSSPRSEWFPFFSRFLHIRIPWGSILNLCRFQFAPDCVPVSVLCRALAHGGWADLCGLHHSGSLAVGPSLFAL